MALTSSPTTFTAKSTANDVGDTAHVDGGDLNNLRTAVINLYSNVVRSQAISVTSDGVVTFVPAYDNAAPVAVLLTPLDSSAATTLGSGYYATNLTSGGISIQPMANGAATGSARATVYYA